MDVKRWDKAVKLDMPDGSQFVSNTVQAVTTLLVNWPERSGKAYRQAAQICMGVLVDALPAKLAQEALILAAIEAAIPVSFIEKLKPLQPAARVLVAAR